MTRDVGRQSISLKQDSAFPTISYAQTFRDRINMIRGNVGYIALGMLAKSEMHARVPFIKVGIVVYKLTYAGVSPDSELSNPACERFAKDIL
jgi:hypothetical protein